MPITKTFHHPKQSFGKEPPKESIGVIPPILKAFDNFGPPQNFSIDQVEINDTERSSAVFGDGTLNPAVTANSTDARKDQLNILEILDSNKAQEEEKRPPMFAQSDDEDEEKDKKSADMQIQTDPEEKKVAVP